MAKKPARDPKDGTKGNPRQMKEVKVVVKKSTPKSVTSFGEVPTRRIDSIKKANPGAGKLIGGGYKGSGGMTTYGRDQSDVIKAALKKK